MREEDYYKYVNDRSYKVAKYGYVNLTKTRKVNNDIRFLLYAILDGHTHLVRLLLNKYNYDFEYDDNDPNCNFESLLVLTTKNGHIQTLKFLLSYKEPTSFQLSSCFVLGCKHGYIDVVEYLIDTVEQYDKDFAIHHAVNNYRPRVHTYLLKNGANYNNRDAYIDYYSVDY
jgi:ankyrin repeat protein